MRSITILVSGLVQDVLNQDNYEVSGVTNAFDWIGKCIAGICTEMPMAKYGEMARNRKCHRVLARIAFDPSETKIMASVEYFFTRGSKKPGTTVIKWFNTTTGELSGATTTHSHEE